MSPLQTLTGEPITDPRELAALIADIVRETERWDQGLWWSPTWFRDDSEVSVQAARKSLNTGCRTTGCVAGWAVILHAPEGSLIDSGDNVVLPNGQAVFASSYGQEALALDDVRASWLFGGHRTQDEVLFALDAIAAGQSWAPEDGEDTGEDTDDDEDYDEDD